MKLWRTRFIATLLITGLCISSTHATEILGAGATFPYPLYSKMLSAYHFKTNVKVNYQSIGSGGGIRQLLNKTVDFGATDGFMSDHELKNSRDAILHIPMSLGAVAIAYNLPGVPKLKLDGTVIANIYLGKIKNWNDPQIQKINPGIKLPATQIVVAHRSDGSGTSAIFTDYLSKVSLTWQQKVGQGTSLNWPTGIGAKGNEGVAGILKLAPGSIGYIELIYAKQNKMTYAEVQNKTGQFISPSLESIAAASDVKIPADTRVSITDSKNGYPISGFTWILVYKNQDYGHRKESQAQDLTNLLWWMTHDGQAYSAALNYVPLPKSVVAKAEVLIKSISYNGVKLKK